MRTEELDGHPCQVIGCRDLSRGPDHAALAVVCVGSGQPMCAPHAVAWLNPELTRLRSIVVLAIHVCEARAEGFPYEKRLDLLHEALVREYTLKDAAT